ncbi:MAG: hypothetical protein ABIK28_07290 [Planctomycetota bacterium]
MDIFELLTPPGNPDRVGDPTGLGWLIFATYLVASAVCAYTGWFTKRKYSRYRGCRDLRSDSNWVWYPLAVFLLLLGINKQLDLQTWLRWFGEKLSRYMGIYEQRREVEALFFIGFAVCGFVVLSLWIVRLKSRWKRYGPMLVGIFCLCLFVVVRTANINHVFSAPRSPAFIQGYGDPLHLFELGSLILILFGALANRFRPKRSNRLNHIP